MTEAASDAAPLAAMTTAPAATLAVALAVRTALPANESLAFAGFFGFAALAVAFAAPGTTFLGAALPKAGFAAS